ncbi:cytochrome P450 protein [Rutstroemia sp. NJR-2017a BVV2]|nr:cytochrome P450 protein [Rutstroemia sp. NJR-2017a BVV2]
MTRRKFNYYVDLSSLPCISNPDKIVLLITSSHKTHLPILTLALPGMKIYIINSLSLIQSVQKQPRTLAFHPIEAKFANRVCGVSPEAHEICMNNVNGEDGNFGLIMDTHAALRDGLLPGAGLDQMNRAMIQNVASSLDSLIPSGDKVVQIARDRIAQAFEEYFHTGGLEGASVLMHNRYEVGTRNGVPVADIARYEVSSVIAILVNTAPAAFWLMYFVYADTKLLEDIRKEVSTIVEVRQDSNGETIRSLDITNLKTSCSLLLSAFQETLRHRSMGTSVREVMTDTILDGKWLLKKNSMIQMPSRVIHLDSDIWGNDVHEFKAGRFLTGTGKEKSKDQKRANPAAFRAFGGGSTLCPGRHFATNEILAIVSMFVMRFDMKPVSGQWKLPKTDNTNVATVIMEPDTDIEVIASARKGFEDGKWAFSLRDSEMILAVVDEDRAA